MLAAPSRHRYTCGFCGYEQIIELGPEDTLGTSYEKPHTYGPRVAPPDQKRSSHLAMLYCTETRLRYAGHYA
jgi:hypothetical protein